MKLDQVVRLLFLFPTLTLLLNGTLMLWGQTSQPVSSSGKEFMVPKKEVNGKWVGQATSGAWSPLLKKNLALATVYRPSSATGTRLRIEVTVEFQRKLVTATVTPTPFFNPERKRS